MGLKWLVLAVIITPASPTSGHFEDVRPVWSRIARGWAPTGLLGATIGALARCFT